MNPLGILLIGIGLIMVVIGFKGSQHNVLEAFKGVPSASKKTTTSKASA
jgi:hypothetical protein